MSIDAVEWILVMCSGFNLATPNTPKTLAGSEECDGPNVTSFIHIPVNLCAGNTPKYSTL